MRFMDDELDSRTSSTAWSILASVFIEGKWIARIESTEKVCNQLLGFDVRRYQIIAISINVDDYIEVLFLSKTAGA